MIFPELPKRHTWIEHSTELVHIAEQAPLHSVEEPRAQGRITVEEWWIKHGLATDPAASSRMYTKKEPIDWFARDAFEFYAICLGMIGWTVYWYGVHIGVWR